jgi:[acyl-carrier-protein] S-malonyltransferase
MAAVLGMEREALEKVCAQASGADAVVVIANDNCPGQLVISGDRAAVERAAALAQEAGAKRVLPLNVSGAFHSPLMEDAATQMRKALEEAEFTRGATRPIYANVTAVAQTDPGIWPDLLEAQLKRPVRWTETIVNMKADGFTTFIEFGVGEVLCGLIRRIDREALTTAVYDLATLEQAQA